MKPRDLLQLLGIRRRPRTYPSEVVTFNLPLDGPVRYAQWQHPGESRKILRQEVVQELRKYIAPGDVALDIGAHTGDTTIPMALAAGTNGRVLALEPNRYVFTVLARNATLNEGKANIVPLMIAATEQPGDFEFQYSDAGFCNGGSHPGISKWRHGHAFPLKVRGENVPAYLARHYPALVARIRFVKTDTEGYDYQVLESLADLIARQRPFIRAEVFKHLDLEQRQRLFDRLVEFDYEVFVVEDDAQLAGPKLRRDHLMARPHYDVFCIPRQGRAIESAGSG